MAGTADIKVPLGPPSTRPRAVLVAAFPASLAFALPVEPIGRDLLARRGIFDDTVSEQHAVFGFSGSAHTLLDLGSTHGTHVDGVPLSPGEKITVSDGAVIRIGQTLFVYRSAFEGPVRPAPPIGGLVGPYGLRGVAAWLARVERSPPVPANVLIEGPSGSGKEALAAAIGDRLRKGKPFTALNATAIPRETFEAELFGYASGAFTGALKGGSPGILRARPGGTVFLDEIGEIPVEHQAKLLRLLEDRLIRPVGFDREVPVDALLVFATNKPLQDAVKSGAFRQDFWERFQARVSVPALADRMEDLPAIVAVLAARNNQSLSPEPAEADVRARDDVLSRARVDVEAIERLMLHPFEGNVRELRRVVWGAVARSLDGEAAPALRKWAVEMELGEVARRPARALTRAAISRALEQAGGNVSEAARTLGVDRGLFIRARARAGV